MAATIPGSVLQFLSVAVPLLINVLIFFLLSACLVFNGKHPHIVAPLKPNSDVGKATNACAWLRAVFALREDDVREAGGLEAVLQLRRLRMRGLICFWWTLLGIPVAVVYALNLLGGSSEAGFDRITFQNANIIRKNTGMHQPGDRWWRNLACAVGAYLLSLLALPIVDKFDQDATELILEDASAAPIEHYAVVVTGIEEAFRDEAILKKIFEGALGERSVVRIELVRDYSKVPEGVVDDKEDSVTAKVLSSGPGGVRQRFKDYVAALKAAKRADLAAQEAASAPASSTRIPVKLTKTPEEAQAEARALVDKKRRALERVADKELAPTSAAIVVFSSLATSTAAATAPLGIRHAWTVSPAPEPRDMLWAYLEKVPCDQAEVETKESVGARLKTSIYVFWSIILIGLVVAAQFILNLSEGVLSGAAKTIVQLVSGLVPAIIASVMMGLVATILRLINASTRVDCWAESKLQAQTQRDFVLFIQMIGFVVPLLGTSLLTGIRDMGGRPLRIFTIIAGNVPVVAYYFAMLVFVKMGGFLNASTRFVPYVVNRVMNRLFVKTEFERTALLAPAAANFAPWVGWESFVFLVAAVYAPVAPYATGVSWIWLSLAHGALRLDLSVVSKTPFATHGMSWRLGVTQTVTIVFVANILQIGILLCSNNLIHFVCTLPVLLIDTIYANRFTHRYLTKSVHGKAKGRLPLLEASDLDRKRVTDLLTDAEKTLESHKLYHPECALNDQPYIFAPLAEDEDIMDRQYKIREWEKRYDVPSKLPAVSVEEVPVDLQGKDSQKVAKFAEMA